MIAALRSNYDKALVAAALAVAALAGVWTYQQRGHLTALRLESVRPILRGSAVAGESWRAPETRAVTWSKPGIQSQGGGWVYEIFTPPVIYYHQVAKTFTVTPPLYFVAGDSVFGLELVAVKRELFRLQLLGYVGGPGDYLVALASPSQPETYFAREGRRFEDLGLELKSFKVTKVAVPNAEALPVYDIAAQAVLQDERTGREVTLDNRERKFTDTPVAVVQLAGEKSPRELREGDSFSDEQAIYRVERVQLDPPEIVVAKQLPGLPSPEIRALHPAAASGVARQEGLTKKLSAPNTSVANRQD